MRAHLEQLIIASRFDYRCPTAKKTETKTLILILSIKSQSMVLGMFSESAEQLVSFLPTKKYYVRSRLICEQNVNFYWAQPIRFECYWILMAN